MRAAVLIRSALGLVLGLATMGMGAAKQNVVRVQILNKVRAFNLPLERVRGEWGWHRENERRLLLLYSCRAHVEN